MRWIAMALLAVLPLGCASTLPADKPEPAAKSDPEPLPPRQDHADAPPPVAGSGGNAAGDPGPAGAPFLGLPDVVVEMEGRKITREEFLKKAVDSYGREVIEELILRYVIDCAVRDTGASVTQKEVDARVDLELLNREKQLKADGKPPLAQVLKQMGKTVEELRTEMRANEDLNRQILLEHICFYSFLTEPSVNVSLIYVRDRQHADNLRKQLKGGPDAPDFGEIAKAESEDEASRANGGKIQTFIYGMGPAGPKFEDAAFALSEPNNTLSPVVPIDDGFFIIKLNKKNPANPQTFESLRDKINQGASLDRPTLSRFMQSLRARYVKGLKYAVPDLEPKKK